MKYSSDAYNKWIEMKKIEICLANLVFFFNSAVGELFEIEIWVPVRTNSLIHGTT